MAEAASRVLHSNLYCMGVSAKYDKRQSIPSQPTIPPEDTRRLRAQLIMEETLETIEGLGFEVHLVESARGKVGRTCDLVFTPAFKPDLEKIIDGNCDIIYVATGTLASCGVLDNPHLAEVCRANDRKFPRGEAIVNESGKFGKPAGWVGPDHRRVLEKFADIDLGATSAQHVAEGAKRIGVPVEEWPKDAPPVDALAESPAPAPANGQAVESAQESPLAPLGSVTWPANKGQLPIDAERLADPAEANQGLREALGLPPEEKTVSEPAASPRCDCDAAEHGGRHHMNCAELKPDVPPPPVRPPSRTEPFPTSVTDERETKIG